MKLSLLALFGLLLVACAHAVMAQGVQEAPAATVEVEEPRPGPPPPLPDLSDPNSKAGEALNEPGERSGIPKALRSSGSRAEARAPPNGDLGPVVAGKKLFYGNYCGKGQRGEGLPPTDGLDAACMRHNACYDTAGYHSCACDAALKREATVVADGSTASLEVRRRALSVVEATAAMDCRAP